MIGPGAGARVMVATRPVDFRKGPDALAALVGAENGGDPFSGVIYVFRAKRSDRIELVWWDSRTLCGPSKGSGRDEIDAPHLSRSPHLHHHLRCLLYRLMSPSQSASAMRFRAR